MPVGIRRFEVTRLRLENGCARGDNVDDFLPTIRRNNRHAGDMAVMLLEKAKVLPGCLPFSSVHFSKVGEDADRMLLVLCDEKFKLWLECFEVFVPKRSGHLETECGSSSFLKSFNHARTPRFLIRNRTFSCEQASLSASRDYPPDEPAGGQARVRAATTTKTRETTIRTPLPSSTISLSRSALSRSALSIQFSRSSYLCPDQLPSVGGQLGCVPADERPAPAREPL